MGYSSLCTHHFESLPPTLFEIGLSCYLILPFHHLRVASDRRESESRAGQRAGQRAQWRCHDDEISTSAMDECKVLNDRRSLVSTLSRQEFSATLHQASSRGKHGQSKRIDRGSNSILCQPLPSSHPSHPSHPLGNNAGYSTSVWIILPPFGIETRHPCHAPSHIEYYMQKSTSNMYSILL